MFSRQINKYIQVMLKTSESLLKSNVNNVAMKSQSASIRPINMSKFGVPKRLRCCGDSIWMELAAFSDIHKPQVNLGEGAADFHAPDLAIRALHQVLHTPTVTTHQYTRSYGHPRLVKAISDFYGHILNREINPMTEVLVTIGSFQGLFSIIMGHIEKDDEVILIEPHFDIFETIVRMAGGIIRTATLRPPNKSGYGNLKASEWCFDKNELEGLFNKNTKMIILNNPHNPVGKCYSEHELKIISDLCIEYNVICLCDEVYEWIVFPYAKHIRMASVPGMWERTLTVGSAGKTFNVTGWKLGWVYGPSTLMKNVGRVHQTCVHCCCSFLQEALAIMFENEIMNIGKIESTLLQRPRDLVHKRDFMIKTFKEHGFIPTISDGTYFAILNYTRLLRRAKEMNNEKDKYPDLRFVKFFTKKAGILLIPLSPFYLPEHKEYAKHYVRACFLRNDQTLQKTKDLLEKWYKSESF